MKLIEVKDLPDSAKSLAVAVAPEEVASELDAVYRKIGSEAEMPGFRKGKVPRPILEKRFAETALKEVLQSLLPSAYDRAVDEAGLHPIESPRYDDVKFDEGKGILFTAVVQVRPEITLPKYDGLALVRRKSSVTDAELEEEIARMLKPHGELETVERPAAAGDSLLFDYRWKLAPDGWSDRSRTSCEAFEAATNGSLTSPTPTTTTTPSCADNPSSSKSKCTPSKSAGRRSSPTRW